MEYKVKGSHVIQIAAWVDKALGAGTYKKRMGELDPSAAVPLALAWYALDPQMKLLEGAARETNKSVMDVVREIAAANARNDLSTIYKVFLKLASPHFVLGQGKKMWSTYAAFGDVNITKNEGQLFLCESRHVPARFDQWVRGAWLGFLCSAVELAGGKNPRAKFHDAPNDPAGNCVFTFELRWE
jgi:hypothetical protein